ncbi:bifunctional sugar-1-phosphate nucleotidylyltransferase/acetyltransferase [Dehalococcoides mccartyi]|jgi:bifunctional UDP-N-acetylglucosamine pyrophosphorylase/glucosamine-1-phosphate N-acetyltransferase|uniref:Nucleotidyl transferase n=2 Tax=Dehalococcoides mccartyi TaxID=61435 RepID=A0A142V8Y3_9CHLR|nr:bifunctional sugar-1-phosphate nucleotidylyltransferase/acetyltransferase [Dehalococcoides mccartyi]AII60630.1 glucose-1-phosphate thymidylyltransferase [Dehalococcoides mccartyi CG5]AMU86296.1 nucleotidyl transferase [Dehalococcoides mccartyi]AOV99132.1 glucose-1-phosphate thymidylyltransferase [Dehalococcoides mccartyi]MBA2084906.1 N-acetylglucosamine-1-phosphate uridyltransferase [Dehalococcoides mccartyi]QBX63642.1 glucose-1-phosphate thymidylyltransferase [Dehalococcoides mccartyi]
MKAVILAAGEGSRMRPLTFTRPKVMLPIAGKPILEHLLMEVSAAGIKEFVLVVGYRDEQVRSYFADGAKWGVKISYCQQTRQLGTAHALKQLENQLEGNFLVMNGDILAESADISALAAGSETTLSVLEVSDPSSLGVLETDGDRVRCIHEKSANPPANLANAGLYLFTPRIFKAISDTPLSPRGEYEITSSIQLLIDNGTEVGYRRLVYWQDVSYPWDLLDVNASMLKNLAPCVYGTVEENVVIKGTVEIGEGSLVRSGAYIEGPVLIGKNCDIGPNCYIRPSTSIGDNCRVGASVEIKNSIIMDNTKIPHLNYVGDSVIGQNCNLGAGTKLANLRFDGADIIAGGVNTRRRKLGAVLGDGVETGINVSLNPGVLIGSGSRIGPGAVVSGLVEPNSYIG